jgi:hypothetical protein
MTSFSTVLSKIPAEERTRFLESMSFANGNLINVNLGAIQGTLADGEVEALMQECGTTTIGYECDAFTAGNCHEQAHSACNAAACKGNKGATVVQLGSLLEGTPPNARNRFLESLHFEKGQLTRADHGVLREHLDEATRAQLPLVRAR